ncbi:hypothetical protein VCRA2121O391_480009 [Vibrio crassostreae]|nr:hypothetical protein VCRA2119O386_450008 [Vibrio crassostreae]CAK2988987.1 hypothetical protein VCRA2121O391_480009 [Vibrio crassostreae]CAK3048557.1 hypothetical protein VCRA2120O390_470008 [Vibrio crassostreae]CAK3584712.1 hypothetical protein VCRA2120O388_470016 [Vibrio crassostreae]CAK3974067.1 hypothetical protein VCRA2133O404_470015 [Vibrio crassostreae]
MVKEQLSEMLHAKALRHFEVSKVPTVTNLERMYGTPVFSSEKSKYQIYQHTIYIIT